MKKYKIRIDDEETGIEIISTVEVFNNHDAYESEDTIIQLMKGFEKVMQVAGLINEEYHFILYPKNVGEKSE